MEKVSTIPFPREPVEIWKDQPSLSSNLNLGLIVALSSTRVDMLLMLLSMLMSGRWL